MPSPTYVALAKTVLTGSQTTITFSSIPNTYTDLILTISGRASTGASYLADLAVKVNSVTTGYTFRWLRGNGATASSSSSSDSTYVLYQSIAGSSADANTFSSIDIYIPNYAGSTNKPLSATSVVENNSATAGRTDISAHAQLLSNTAAISSLTLTLPYHGDFVSGSRFDLYGIKNS